MTKKDKEILAITISHAECNVSIYTECIERDLETLKKRISLIEKGETCYLGSLNDVACRIREHKLLLDMAQSHLDTLKGLMD